ncbi:FAD binding domain-containing protein [Thermosipho atlanticus]|uniref:Xanthine dehydrogenase FAD-binding subunit n=1 Tax=Thermosipho atlanticus DSM 15807 TaxID=1123380 RepID=A0A1M5QQZ1_9BACT|nr:FAD binding domain-containing protein [Thermosipho atlanticus]SHH16492.1 xanthine dehydrogenase FAD-binding subunit [Thermosipho atlanticus DSM 15807]
MIKQYFRPTNIDELSELKLKTNGYLFAGGTDLLVKIRAGTIKTETLIDTKYLETDGIKTNANKLFIPLNTTYTELRKFLKQNQINLLLEEIIKTIGSPMIRNRGTPVGNIGNASPAGDFVLASYLFNAQILIEPTSKKIPINQFIKGPGKIELSDDEFIYGIELEILENYKYYFEKVGRRNAMIISIASVGMLLKEKEGKIEDIRIALGSVAPYILRDENLEKSVIGKEINEDLFKFLASSYQKIASPITDVRATKEYRKTLVYNLILKAYNNLYKKVVM